jgi:hypothetical protein
MRKITIGLALGAAVMASPALAQTGGGTTGSVQRPQGGAEGQMNKQEIAAPAKSIAKPTTAAEKKGMTKAERKGSKTMKKSGHETSLK